jgi:hypothetical protein
MILLIAITALSAAGVVSTIVVTRRDGYRRIPARPRGH